MAKAFIPYTVEVTARFRVGVALNITRKEYAQCADDAVTQAILHVQDQYPEADKIDFAVTWGWRLRA
jgi:hypothetical protein